MEKTKEINKENVIKFIKQCESQADYLLTSSYEYADSLHAIEIRELQMLANEWFGLELPVEKV